MSTKERVAHIKFWAAILSLVLSGAFLAMGICAWYYGDIIDTVNKRHESQVRRYERELKAERGVNRKSLDTLTGRVSVVSDNLTLVALKLDEIAARLDQAAIKADAASSSAGTAASTAKAAAATARDAAKNAQEAVNAVQEVHVIPPRNPPKWLDGP